MIVSCKNIRPVVAEIEESIQGVRRIHLGRRAFKDGECRNVGTLEERLIDAFGGVSWLKNA